MHQIAQFFSWGEYVPVLSNRLTVGFLVVAVNIDIFKLFLPKKNKN